MSFIWKQNQIYNTKKKTKEKPTRGIRRQSICEDHTIPFGPLHGSIDNLCDWIRNGAATIQS